MALMRGAGHVQGTTMVRRDGALQPRGRMSQR
jgi:hypothetical protein